MPAAWKRPIRSGKCRSWISQNKRYQSVSNAHPSSSWSSIRNYCRALNVPSFGIDFRVKNAQERASCHHSKLPRLERWNRLCPSVRPIRSWHCSQRQTRVDSLRRCRSRPAFIYTCWGIWVQ
jgi:hypothetical protein